MVQERSYYDVLRNKSQSAVGGRSLVRDKPTAFGRATLTGSAVPASDIWNRVVGIAFGIGVAIGIGIEKCR